MGFLLKSFYALLATLLFLLHTRLILVPNVEAIKTCIGRERKALLLFKQGIHTDEHDFDALSTWRDGDDEDCCNWKGVSCSNKTGHVQILDLHSLEGIINITLLSELHHLKHLDVSDNDFYPSEIPESIELFTNLRYLNLSFAHFAGSIPGQLGKLSNLLYLDLSSNNFDGAIPWQIGNLSKLQYLNLQRNDLIGVIPYQLGNLSMLHTLQLGDNINLTVANQNNDGVEWISKLSSLTDLDLSLVSGVGHSQIWLQMVTGKLVPKLRKLRLVGCGISYAHNLPLSASPSNYSASLITLDLSYNNLNNPSLFQWLFNFSSTSLQELYLENCSLSSHNLDLLFSHFHFSSLTVLSLSFNNFTLVTTMNFGSNLQELYLKRCSLSSNNLIFSSFNPNLTSLVHLDMSANQLTSFNANLTSLVHLDLCGNHLTSAAIFYWISNFTYNLHVADLGFNLLNGSIPDDFGNIMNSLQVLDVRYNNLQGEVPTSLGNICTLKNLRLGHNNLSGELPSFISNACDVHPLQTLSLGGNRLTGISPNLSVFPFLEVLDLSDNQLKGKIPESIGLMSQLTYLSLDGNNLGGVITESHFKSLSNLVDLLLSGNSLTLKINPSWVPPFQLQFLEMASCMIGPNFPNWLRYQHQIISLNISDGKLSGSVPNWFWSQLGSMAHLNIAYNNFVGKIPNLPLKLNLQPSINLTSNNFEGAVPSYFWQASELYLSENKFSNLIPLLCGQSEDGDIAILDLSNNQLRGHLPNCWSKLNSLQFVDLSNNNLSGEIPSSIGHLVNIQALVLKNNSLTGELPSSLVNCSQLLLLDVSKNKLSGPIPSWIGVNVGQLKILSLRMNHFYGSLPVNLCQLTQIQLLDLSCNNFSNEIPSCLQKFTVMAQKHINLSIRGGYDRIDLSTYSRDSYHHLNFYITLMWKGKDSMFFRPDVFLKSIDLSSNALSGEIPRELVSLFGLVSLNLSSNQLSGEIPRKIGNLESLEFLDLSKNKLSGPIPLSLAHIDRLSVLDLSNNSLSGKIPTGTQLQSFNASSYEGNLDLCGLPLNKKCPGDNKMPPPQEAKNDEKEDASFFPQEVYLSMGLGFFVGFWAFVGPFLFNRTWRQAFYRFVNIVTDKVHVMVAIHVVKYLTIRD